MRKNGEWLLIKREREREKKRTQREKDDIVTTGYLSFM
jgi:hypothetical protein